MVDNNNKDLVSFKSGQTYCDQDRTILEMIVRHISQFSDTVPYSMEGFCSSANAFVLSNRQIYAICTFIKVKLYSIHFKTVAIFKLPVY